MRFWWHEADESQQQGVEDAYWDDMPPEIPDTDSRDQDHVLPPEYLPTSQLVKRTKPKDIVPGLAFECSVGILVGAPFTGKSLLLADLGLALAAKQPWLTWPAVEQTSVLLYALDSPGWETKEQVSCLMAGRGIDPNQPWPFAVITQEAAINLGKRFGGPPDIMNKKWFEHICQTATETGAKFIGIDSFSKSHRCEENSRTDMEAVMWQFARLAHRTNAHILLLHHEPVMGRENSVYAGRGSSVISASVDFAARLTKKEFVVLKSRGSDFGDTKIKVARTRVEGHPTEPRAVRWEVLQPDTKLTIYDQIKVLVEAILADGKVLSKDDIYKAAFDLGINGNIDNVLTRLRSHGVIESSGKGYYALCGDR